MHLSMYEKTAYKKVVKFSKIMRRYAIFSASCELCAQGRIMRFRIRPLFRKPLLVEQ